MNPASQIFTPRGTPNTPDIEEVTQVHSPILRNMELIGREPNSWVDLTPHGFPSAWACKLVQKVMGFLALPNRIITSLGLQNLRFSRDAQHTSAGPEDTADRKFVPELSGESHAEASNEFPECCDHCKLIRSHGFLGLPNLATDWHVTDKPMHSI